MNAKRGFSHIEIIMGFVIFAGAILFALVYLKLSYNPMEKSVESTYEDIEKNLKGKVYQYSLRLEQPGIDTTEDIIAVKVENDAGNVSVFNYAGSKTNAFLKNGILYFNKSGRGDKFEITISSYISANSEFGKPDLNESYYSLGPALERDIVTEGKMIDFNRSYYKEYDSLKSETGIKNDFNIYVQFKEGDMIMKRDNTRKSVFSKNKNIEVLRQDGKIDFLTLRIDIW